MSAQTDGAPLTRVESYQWPSGHVGHLSEGQLATLEKFKELSKKKGYFTAGDDINPPSHDDETLLRYLRARKFVPREAFTQLKETEDWRKENQLDKLYETIDIKDYEKARRLYPQWIGRRDKRGIPFYVFQIADLDPKDVTAYTNSKDKQKQSTNTKLPWKMLVLFALYENLCRFVLPMCSVLPDRSHLETPISQSNNIVDLNGVGLAKLFNMRNHMSDASKLATAYYPETLDRIFVVGAPSYFPTIWKWIQAWFDPITVSKIFILTNKDMKSTLEKFVDIENIPKQYGGKLDWKFGDMPNLEPAIVNNLDWKEKVEENGRHTFPIGPMKWHYADDGELLATAIGTEKGKSRQRVIAGLRPAAGVARLSLLPGRVHTSTQTSTPLDVSGNSTPQPQKSNMNSDANLNVGKDPNSSLQQSSRAGTYTVPYKDDTNGVASPPPDARQGTTTTRYEQQADTHAEGQLAEGTPEVKRDGAGDRVGVMEPNTVGQAPKEHPVPEQEEPQPGVMEQAKDMAGQAVEQAKQVPSTVMSAVGMGSKKENEVPSEQESKEEDPEVDAMASKNVEEFLRSQHKSKMDT